MPLMLQCEREREREREREFWREKGKRGSLSMVKQSTHCDFVDGFGLVF